MASSGKRPKLVFIWLCQVFIAAHGPFVAVCGFSLVVASKGYSLDVVYGLLIAVAFLAAELRLSTCGTRV